MRKNFAQVLREAKVDIRKEYDTLFDLAYGEQEDSISFHDTVNRYFQNFPFRGTCIDLDDFNKTHGFHFEPHPKNFDMDYLVTFCEYIYNLSFALMACTGAWRSMSSNFLIEQVDRVIESIGYTSTQQDGFTIFVEKSPAATSVSETLPAPTSYKVIAYNHHSMQGNLQEKRATLLELANILEPQKPALRSANKDLASDLFYLFNNLDIRHNNSDPNAGPKHKPEVSNMETSTIEQWYDETYQMCLLAFLSIDHIERKKRFDTLKASIEQN